MPPKAKVASTSSDGLCQGRLDETAQLRARGDETPWDDVEIFCAYLGIDVHEYDAILEGFRNRELWTRRNSRWVIDGFLVPDYPWPADPVVNGET